MSTSQLGDLPGKWSGTSRLFLEKDVYDSESTADSHHIGQGQFSSISYNWQFESEPQDGRIVFLAGINEKPSRAIWLDSWHMRNDIMLCEGTKDQEGIARLQGSYSFPPGPAWGWRIEIGINNTDLLLIRMFNIAPAGQEMLAVLARYERIIERA